MRDVDGVGQDHDAFIIALSMKKGIRDLHINF